MTPGPTTTPTTTTAAVPQPPPTPPADEDKIKQAEEEHTRQQKEAKSLLDQAIDSIKLGRRDRAKTLLRRITKEFPKTDAAPHALVQLAEIESDLAEADKTLARVIQDYPKTEWAEVAWYKRGEVNMLLWDYAVALEMFQQYLKRNPKSERAGAIRRQMAICQLKLGQGEKALAELERLTAEKPEMAGQPETLETLADCHVQLGRSDRALPLLETLTKKHPTYADRTRALLILALCLEDQNRFRDAIGAYSRLIEQFPKSSEARLAEMRLADLRRPLLLHKDDKPSTSPVAPAAAPLPVPKSVSPLPDDRATTAPAAGRSEVIFRSPRVAEVTPK